MNRWHLFEFGDQSWLPRLLREIYMDCMKFAFSVGGHYAKMHEPFATWASRTGESEVLDLASGGGAPIGQMIRGAAQSNTTMPQVYLSDLHPNLRHYRDLQLQHGNDQLSYVSEPVDVLNIGRPQFRLCSVCTAFHHFRPKDAARVIATFGHERDGFFIMEPLQRDWKHLALMIISGPWIYMLTPFFHRPFRWSRLIFCTLLPIVPLMVFIDGCVSVMRIYRPEEIREMLPDKLRKNFTIEHGTQPHHRFFAASFIYGIRKKEEEPILK